MSIFKNSEMAYLLWDKFSTDFFTMTDSKLQRACILHLEKILLKSMWNKENFYIVLQPKRIFLCNKEKYIWFECLLRYFKDPLLKSNHPVL